MAENVVQLNKSSQQDIDRKIAVIFVTDVVGFSKSMEVNEEETLRSFRACQEILDKLFEEHGGRIFNTAGDSVLAEFQSAVSAVVCANEFQKLIKERNKSVSEESQMSFRIGLNMGDVIIEGDNLYGEGVNVAARLEALSQANGICVSKSIVDFVSKKTELLFNDLGEQKVKNTEVHAYDIADPDLQVREKNDKKLAEAAAEKITKTSKAPSVAVLPFLNLSNDSEQDFFVDGITEDIISYLSKLKTFPIISINSVISYKDTKEPTQKIASELGVSYLVQGSIRKGGNKARIMAKLTDAIEDTQIWSQTWDRSLDDVFEVQDEVSQKSAALISPAIINNERKKLSDRDMNALSSWDEYLQAVNSYVLMNSSKTTEEKLLHIYKSMEHGEKAIALDPNHSSAFNLLAQAHNYLIFESSVQDKRAENDIKFREYTEKAFQLDPQNPDSIMNMGFIAFLDGDRNRFTDYVNKAFEVNPHHSRTLRAKGMNLVEDGKDFTAAIDAFTKAAEIDPLGEHYGQTVIFFCHLGNRDWENANQSLDREMRENNHSRYFGFKAVVLAHQGKVEESKEWLSKYQKERPEIKNIEDYRTVAPSLNEQIKNLLIEGMKMAGLPE